MELVINNCYGGFSLSDAGIARYLELKGMKLNDGFYHPIHEHQAMNRFYSL